MCNLVADEGSANTVVAVVTWRSGEAGTLHSLSLLSMDGGAHWRRLTGEIVIGELETTAGKLYATDYDTDSIDDARSHHLVVSTDALHTWRELRPASIVATDSFFGFQLGPAAGELIAASYHDSVWRTVDDGLHWTQIRAPAVQTNLYRWLPQTGASGCSAHGLERRW